MVRKFVAAFVLSLGMMITAASVAEAGDGAKAQPTSSVVTTYAWMWADKNGPATPRWPVLPVAACTADCCCHLFEGGSMKNQCLSRDQCIDAGGICRSKTDSKCN